MDSAFTIMVPGAFDTFLSGTGVVQGDPWSSDPEQESDAAGMRAAYVSRKVIPRGRGYSMQMALPTIGAVVVLAEYAVACLNANQYGDMDYSEMAAARKLLERCSEATGGRVSYDGWHVRLDGEVVK